MYFALQLSSMELGFGCVFSLGVVHFGVGEYKSLSLNMWPCLSYLGRVRLWLVSFAKFGVGVMWIASDQLFYFIMFVVNFTEFSSIMCIMNNTYFVCTFNLRDCVQI